MTAHAYLEDILLMSPTEYREKIYELYGDVLYLSSGSHDDVKKLYTVALSGSDNPRIQQKLQYLDATGSYL